jgi:hypothetical protein
MRRINAILVLALTSCPLTSFAEGKKEPPTLAAEAAALAEKSGKNGWASDEVTVSMDDGKKKAKGKLLMKFSADKDKPTGGVALIVDHGTSAVAKGPLKFELVEKDGKRSIKFLEAKPGPKEDPDPKVLATLEYSLKSDELTIKGGVLRAVWAGWDVDLTKGITFKAAGV